MHFLKNNQMLMQLPADFLKHKKSLLAKQAFFMAN